jgi:CRISPR-associated exonuclease Cas4
MFMLFLALAFLLIAFVMLFISGRQRRAAGLPLGNVIYSDTRTWGRVEQPLFDPKLGLVGKPDYLVKQDGILVPVEVKTGRTPALPYDSHIFQLAVYCLLVHRTYDQRPPYGILHYPGRDFAVNYSPELESNLLSLLADIRRAERRANVRRSHEELQRCQKCGFHQVCDQSLT